MRFGPNGGNSRALKVLFEEGAVGILSDAELIERFLDRGSGRAEAAFAALVDRHGGMVLSLCRRSLGDPHDAQDAFQATFLTLALRAGSIRRRESVACWLHGVAVRVSARMRTRRHRRRAVERDAVALRAVGEAAGGPPGWVELHEELARLPEVYRAPTLLCYVEELTNEEAAARLRLPVGTVKTRLRRARDLLRTRLAGRAEASPMPLLLAAALRPDPAAVVAARNLADSTARMAVASVSGLSGAAIPPAVAGLVRGAFGAWTLAKFAGGAAALLVVGAALGVLATRQDPTEEPGDVPPIVAETETPRSSAMTDAPLRDEATPAADPQEAPATDAGDEAPSRHPSALATVLSGIEIDGDLSDWPRGLARHPIANVQILQPYYDWNGLEGADLEDNDDLSATFSVGYDPARDLIYLAVVVRDDRTIVGHRGFWDTDAVEVYVDGLCSERQVPRSVVDARSDVVDASELPVLQYVGIPGEGRIYGVTRSAGRDQGPINPALMYGRISETSTRMAYKREGGRTVYEWAIQAFDRYPDRPTDLVPGKRIGLDVVVVDKDVPAGAGSPQDEPEQDRAAWVSWYPKYRGPRFLNAADLGELILGH